MCLRPHRSDVLQNLLKQPDDFIGIHGNKIQRKMTVDEISFSAHVDFQQNSSFIREVNPKHIVSLDFKSCYDDGKRSN